MVGRHLYRVACALCSDAARENIVAPAIADFQHQYASAVATPARIHALISGYATVWQTLVWCFVCDALSYESRAFYLVATAAFLLAIGVTASIEYALFDTDATLHQLAMRVPYLYWSHISTTTTFEFGVPLAMFQPFCTLGHVADGSAEHPLLQLLPPRRC